MFVECGSSARRAVRLAGQSCLLMVTAAAIASSGVEAHSEVVPPVPPRYLNSDGLASLQRAFAEATDTATSASRMRQLPAFADAATLNSNVLDLLGTGASRAPSAATVQQSSEVTTVELQSTLALARQDAGEARELAEELHQKAEELVNALVASLVPGERPAAKTGDGLPRNEAASAASRPSAASSAASALAAAMSGPQDADSRFESPDPAGKRAAVVAALPAEQGEPRSSVGQTPPAIPSPPLEGRMALGVAPELTPAPPAIATASVNPQVAPLEPPLPSRAFKGTSASRKDRPGRKHSSTGEPAQGKQAPHPVKEPKASPASEPGAVADAPKTKWGGLFSWFKPFQLPREIGALGWAN